MRTIPKQYISRSDYPTDYDYGSEQYRFEADLKAMELQYDRWVDDLLDRIRDLEEKLLAHQHHLDNMMDN